MTEATAGAPGYSYPFQQAETCAAVLVGVHKKQQRQGRGPYDQLYINTLYVCVNLHISYQGYSYYYFLKSVRTGRFLS